MLFNSDLEKEGSLNVLTDDTLLHIFSFFHPEQIQIVALVCHRWREISDQDAIWRPFCCPHWEIGPPPNAWKKMYISWLRRMAQRLKEIHRENEKMVRSYVANGRSRFIPITFFWPSFKALRERYAFKILVIGDSGVGKTELIKRFTNNESRPIQQELRRTTIQLHGNTIELQILDGGHNLLQSKVGMILQAHGCMVLFDVNSPNGVVNASNWIKKIQKHNSHAVMCLVGTKCDVEMKRSSSSSNNSNSSNQGQELAQSLKIPYFETSAKTNEGVSQAFERCTEMIYKSLAWPNYVPPEIVFRNKVGVAEVDWYVAYPGTGIPEKKTDSCSIQ
eukprot:TRINITY_DN2632_c0_g1_i8.p1 TRINITY_DN2632_c0_g1~~TRINITY_DN2632_c0_g1_i8.p1  ORF type:complete len:333 (-),score=56.52 TRINITY_DN2632_c0_g1_i8:1-999(-)